MNGVIKKVEDFFKSFKKDHKIGLRVNFDLYKALKEAGISPQELFDTALCNYLQRNENFIKKAEQWDSIMHKFNSINSGKNK